MYNIVYNIQQYPAQPLWATAAMHLAVEARTKLLSLEDTAGWLSDFANAERDV